MLWLREVILAHGLDTSSLALVGPQLALGIGIGMIVSPLFDFILASVRDNEVGSASGVAQRAPAARRARSGSPCIGTIFFTTLAHDGFVTAISRCLLVELATMPVLLLLSFTLPSRAPDRDGAEAIGEPEPHSGGRVAAVDRALVGAGETR